MKKKILALSITFLAIVLISTFVILNENEDPIQPIAPEVTMKWGAFAGNIDTDLPTFEALVGKPVDIAATFIGFDEDLPTSYEDSVGKIGKTLLIYWEPSVGYDAIINGSQDENIKRFAMQTASYSYPIILAPFSEMNIDEEVWGYGQGGNTAAKFVAAWHRVHDLFINATNVKFALAYNHVSVPDVAGNQFQDYYPGDAYVDYMALDGFNFDDPWLSFGEIFDEAIGKLNAYNKPIYILSTASAPGPKKAQWIKEGLGEHIKTYKNVVGWVWFNQNKEVDWRVDSDRESLEAFKEVVFD